MRSVRYDIVFNAFITDRVSGKGNAIGRVRPSVCLFVSTLSFELTDL